jgi:uncharacterized protein YecT (DUF1311 family)
MRLGLHRTLVKVAAPLGLVALAAASHAKDLDCSKEVFSSAENYYCEDERLAIDLEALRAINAEITKRVEEYAIGERRGTIVRELEDANRIWMDFAVKYCRALNAERGGGSWPDFWITSCVRNETQNRIRHLCEPDLSVDPLGACERIKKKP